MDITPQISKNKNSIDSYGNEGFKVKKNYYKKTIIITPDKLLELKTSSIKGLEELLISQLNSENIFDSQIEILLIGTGKHHVRISEKLKNNIKSSYPQITIDEMSSFAACRTYNILITEDRNVAAILLSAEQSE